MRKYHTLSGILAFGAGLATAFYTSPRLYSQESTSQPTTQRVIDKNVLRQESALAVTRSKNFQDALINSNGIENTDERLDYLAGELSDIYRGDKSTPERKLITEKFGRHLTFATLSDVFDPGRRTKQSPHCEPLCFWEEKDVDKLQERFKPLVSEAFMNTPANCYGIPSVKPHIARTYALAHGIEALERDAPRSKLFEGESQEERDKVILDVKKHLEK